MLCISALYVLQDFVYTTISSTMQQVRSFRFFFVQYT